MLFGDVSRIQELFSRVDRCENQPARQELWKNARTRCASFFSPVDKCENHIPGRHRMPWPSRNVCCLASQHRMRPVPEPPPSLGPLLWFDCLRNFH